MIRVKYSWLIVLLAGLCWGCQETEVLETYEQVKETTQPVPIAFNPYVLSQPEISADTRADLSYLSYIENTNNNNLNYFNFIPCLGFSAGTAKSWGKDKGTAASNNPEYNYRFGRTATNSYIVGVYAFSHGSNNWNAVSSTATANLMTNQPLLRVPKRSGDGFVIINGVDGSGNGYARTLNERSLWDYEPKKYWPIGEKVTFISYYPYQDYRYKLCYSFQVAFSVLRFLFQGRLSYYLNSYTLNVSDKFHNLSPFSFLRFLESVLHFPSLNH